MTAHPRKMVFLDVDGTYLAGDRVPPSAADAVRAARANGHLVLLCTGRALVQIYPWIREAGFDGIIAAAGGMVMVGDEVLASQALTPELVDRATTWLDERGIAYWLETDAALHASASLERLLEDVPPQPYLAIPFADAGAERGEVRKIILMGSTIPLEETRAAFAGNLDIIGATIPALGDNMGELALPGVHKATGIEVAARHAGVDRADTVGFGDGTNDLEMLAWCGVGVAMGDAADVVKDTADLVVAPAADGGIAEGFAKLGLI